MTGGEEHLYNMFFLEHVLTIASVLIYFVSCANQFLASVFHSLMLSLSLGLRRFKLGLQTDRLTSRKDKSFTNQIYFEGSLVKKLEITLEIYLL